MQGDIDEIELNRPVFAQSPPPADENPLGQLAVATLSQEQQGPFKGRAAPLFHVEGEVQEVLQVYGVAYMRTALGRHYELNRKTLGAKFALLRAGQLVRCELSGQNPDNVLRSTVISVGAPGDP